MKAVQMKDPRQRETNGDANQSLDEQLRRLGAHVDSDISVEEFGSLVRELVRGFEPSPKSIGRQHETAFLDVLIRNQCHPRLLAEITRVLLAEDPGRTIKFAARHAEVDRKTLERDWRNLCSAHSLADCIRLVVLLRIARGTGSEANRARAAEMDLRTARNAARALTAYQLTELIGSPSIVVETLKNWLKS
jgi:hypothetical protein